MKIIIRLLVTSVLVMIISHLMKGVIVDEFMSALTVAVVLALLNLFVKPILVVLTFPVTILTLGFFYLVINAAMILVCDHFIDGFKVSTFWTAMLFSIILSLSQSIVFKLTNND